MLRFKKKMLLTTMPLHLHFSLIYNVYEIRKNFKSTKVLLTFAGAVGIVEDEWKAFVGGESGKIGGNLSLDFGG